ncbi:hypothetical protein ACTXT7_000730 [Hymenolepis weldensis]
MQMVRTLWNPKGIIPGSVEFIHYLKESGRKVLLVSNNSTKSSEIVCSANITANYLAKQGIKGPLYVMGQSGIAEELDKVGIEYFGIGPDNTPIDDFNASHLRDNVPGVIVGFDSYFNYMKVMKATSYILRGSKFYVTNEDALLPCDEFAKPGTGSIVASVRKATGMEPTVFGKPFTTVWDFIKEKYGAEEKTSVIIGDRLDTDIQMGKAAGLCTVCVMSGVTSETLLLEVRADPVKAALLAPDLVYPTIREMHQQLMEEDKKSA